MIIFMCVSVYCWNYYVYPLDCYAKAELSRALIGADTYGGEGGEENPNKSGSPLSPYGFTPNPNFPLPLTPPSPLFLWTKTQCPIVFVMVNVQLLLYERNIKLNT